MKFHTSQVQWVREDGTVDQEKYNKALAELSAKRRRQPRQHKLPRKNRRAVTV